MLLSFTGPRALSDFRRLPLLERCREILPDLTDLQARYLYAVLLDRPITDAERDRLAHILDVSEPLPPRSDNQVAICPRPGTTSPWSTKATDILKNCGLDFVHRVERGILYDFATSSATTPALPLLYDRMTEAPVADLSALFHQVEPQPLARIRLLAEGRDALVAANAAMGLALAEDEIDYFLSAYQDMGRDPTDVELMMFSVVNSEHCRHKIFNADWIVDGQRQ